MNVEKYLPLTETTFYILISLIEPGHGYSIMRKVEELSNGKVRVAAGTMYGAIEILEREQLIKSIESADKRRKVYEITAQGMKVLKSEVSRLKYLIGLAERMDLC